MLPMAASPPLRRCVAQLVGPVAHAAMHHQIDWQFPWHPPTPSWQAVPLMSCLYQWPLTVQATLPLTVASPRLVAATATVTCPVVRLVTAMLRAVSPFPGSYYSVYPSSAHTNHTAADNMNKMLGLIQPACRDRG